MAGRPRSKPGPGTWTADTVMIAGQRLDDFPMLHLDRQHRLTAVSGKLTGGDRVWRGQHMCVATAGDYLWRFLWPLERVHVGTVKGYVIQYFDIIDLSVEPSQRPADP